MRAYLLVLACAGCFYRETPPLPDGFGECATTDDGTAGAAQPTWYRDVEPIVVAKCQTCHVDGGLAPFPLVAYQDFIGVRDTIREAVTARTMPPWQPDPCCNHYRFDRSLTDAERDTLVRWLELGVPLGDPADEQPVFPPPTGLPRIDLHATMAAGFAPAEQVGTTELRCFVLDHAPIDRTRYITGFDFHPGVRAEVHHVIALAVDEDVAAELAAKDGADGRPGWDCNGEAAELGGSKHFIGGWQPGDTTHLLPTGEGIELPAHTRIYLQIHYDAGHGTLPDLSSLDLMLEDHVDRIQRGTALANPLWFVGDGMEIRAGDPDAHVWFAWDPTVLTHGRAIELENVMVHMHELGTIGRAAVLHADGTTECLLNITHWSFHWLGDYYFETPVHVAPGDQLYVECHWDNTAAHQPIKDGAQQTPRTLHWGADQEMCGAVLTYSEAVTP